MNIFKGPFAPKMPYWLKKRKDLLHILKQLNNMLLNFFRMSDPKITLVAKAPSLLKLFVRCKSIVIAGELEKKFCNIKDGSRLSYAGNNTHYHTEMRKISQY